MAHNHPWRKWQAFSPTGVLWDPSCGRWWLSWDFSDEEEQLMKMRRSRQGFKQSKGTKEESMCACRKWVLVGKGREGATSGSQTSKQRHSHTVIPRAEQLPKAMTRGAPGTHCCLRSISVGRRQQQAQSQPRQEGVCWSSQEPRWLGSDSQQWNRKVQESTRESLRKYLSLKGLHTLQNVPKSN